MQEITTQYPNLIPLSNTKLNENLAFMLTEILKRGSDKDEENSQIIEPEDVTYICPGGGGRRLQESLNSIGYATLQYLDIATERPPENKEQAIVSAKSVEDISKLEKKKARVIVILDDAINGGWTVREIIKAIRSNSDLEDATIIVGSQIRFVPKGADTGYVDGVEGCAVVTALSLVSCVDKESAALTYLSSHAKRDPDEDNSRLEKMAGGADKKLLVDSIKEVKRSQLQKDHLPETEGFKRFNAVLSNINDAQTMLEFIGDALTKEEIDQWSKRLAAAEMLRAGKTLQDVSISAQLSPDTVTRVKTWCKYGFGGYEDVLRKNKIESGNLPLPDRSSIPIHLQSHVPDNSSFERLVSLLTIIPDPETMVKFIGDSLTHKEMLDIGNRTEAAYQRYNEEDIRRAMTDSGLGRETAVRVYEWYENGFGGYKKGFDALETRQAKIQEQEI